MLLYYIYSRDFWQWGMDSLTLSLVIIIFLASLAFFFATADGVPISPTPLPENPAACINNIRISPALLRQNVAVGRLVRMQGL